MTNTTEAEEAVLKTDVLGRVKTPKERPEALLDEFEGSGLSGMKFAELTGFNYQTCASWAQRRRRERKQSPTVPGAFIKSASQVRWLEAVVDQTKLPAGSAQSVLVVHLSGGTRMEIADAAQAALAAVLLRLLENKAPTLMLSFAGGLKVFVALEACDMRKGCNGLHALVTGRLEEDPRQGALFVFTNRRRTRLKILFWDGAVALRQAAGARNFFLAQERGAFRHEVAARPGSAGASDRWGGVARSQAASVV